MKQSAVAGVLAVSLFSLAQAHADPGADHRDGGQGQSSRPPAPAARPAAAAPAAQAAPQRSWGRQMNGGPATPRAVQPQGAPYGQPVYGQPAYGQPAYGARQAPGNGQSVYAPQRGTGGAATYGQGGYSAPRGGAVAPAYGQGAYAPQRGAGAWTPGQGSAGQGYAGRAGEGTGTYRPGGGRPAFGAPGFAPGGPQPRYQRDYFPRNVRYPHPYEWRGEWTPPPGFYYRRWAYGEFLPWGWYDRPFWIVDYYDYDLPVPPYGFAWIRVGPDVVLVNLATGMVVETVYGAFY